MSLEIKGQSCPICRAYLFDDDEIAVCPTCGAPHHRECFVNAKHCGMECFHGTDMQYDRVRKEENAEKEKEEQGSSSKDQNQNILIECPVCKKRYPINSDTCPGCGANNNFAAHAHRFDILGGVEPTEDLGQGHKAKDVAAFIGGMTSRLIPKFKQIKLGKKVSFGIWNFLFPAARFAARKMYKEAFIFGAVQVAAALLLLPFGNSDVIPTNQGNIDYSALYAISETIVKSPKFIMASVGTVLQFIGMIISGLFADVFYYKHVINTLTHINGESNTSEEKLLSYRKKGGFNLFGFLLTVMIINYSVSLIAILVGII